MWEAIKEDERPDGMREFAAMMKEAADGEKMMMLAFLAGSMSLNRRRRGDSDEKKRALRAEAARA